jgi:hypothetical protein
VTAVASLYDTNAPEAAVAAVAEQPHGVSARAASATPEQVVLSAVAAVTAVAEQHPAIAAGPAGTTYTNGGLS